MMWRIVMGWPYDVREDGVVRRAGKGNVLKQRLHKSGYMVVQLWSCGKYWTTGVHQLVAAAFLGDKPSDEHEVGHRDGVSTNNHYENLKWVLHLESMEDRERHGRTARSSANGKTKYTDAQVAEAKAAVRTGQGLPAVARKFGMSVNNLHQYMKGARRPYIP